MIRQNIINDFTGARGLFQNGIKFHVLDEIDSMTKNAQQALKILLQNIKTPTRFCLITNYLSKVDMSLRNFCVSMRFNQLPRENILDVLKHINHVESVGLHDNELKSIAKKYCSDMRSMINYMQCIQLEVQSIITNSTWDELTIGFQKDTQQSKTILFENILLKYNIPAKDAVKSYFNYIIRNRSEFLSDDFLKFIENILHCNCSSEKYLKSYFIINISKFL